MWAPEDITDYDGHGTAVASVAGGRVHGVASKANLVIVKFRNAALAPLASKNGFEVQSPNLVALLYAWDWIINDVAEQREEGNDGGFIINMSYCGFSVPFSKTQALINGEACDPDSYEFVALRVQWCWDRDIVTIVPAGNRPKLEFLDEDIPQNIGTPGNGLITVGGVTEDGGYWSDTTRDRGLGGSITVYAQAEGVLAASAFSDTRNATFDGTSFAAPAVVSGSPTPTFPFANNV